MNSVAEIVDGVKEGRTSAAAVAGGVGGQLAAPEVQQLNAVLDWSQEALDEDAARADAAETYGPLAGVPVAIKDNIVTVEQPTTCASRPGIPVALRRYRRQPVAGRRSPGRYQDEPR